MPGKQTTYILFGMIILLMGTSVMPCLSGGALYDSHRFEHLPTMATPPTPIRNIAEFEPMEGVLIRYPFGISYEIIAEMSEDVEIVTIVANINQQNYVLVFV